MATRTRADRGRLPRDWRTGLPQSVIATVLLVERYSARGLFILSKPDHKGYVWVRLCEGHPYANKAGWQRLHRYLMMRVLGRPLRFNEHVHHDPEHDKTTTNIRHLVLTESIDHGHLHYAKRLSKGGKHFMLWKPRQPNGQFTKYPTVATVAQASDDPVPF